MERVQLDAAIRSHCAHRHSNKFSRRAPDTHPLGLVLGGHQLRRALLHYKHGADVHRLPSSAQPVRNPGPASYHSVGLDTASRRCTAFPFAPLSISVKIGREDGTTPLQYSPGPRARATGGARTTRSRTGPAPQQTMPSMEQGNPAFSLGLASYPHASAPHSPPLSSASFSTPGMFERSRIDCDLPSHATSEAASCDSPRSARLHAAPRSAHWQALRSISQCTQATAVLRASSASPEPDPTRQTATVPPAPFRMG
ncbi:hypothetical protein DFH06DRAFT_338740 [Mycena polygramma]|nr:hypothetical protein DFH06DRAFT_338740 [Mycena polygramma]